MGTHGRAEASTRWNRGCRIDGMHGVPWRGSISASSRRHGHDAYCCTRREGIALGFVTHRSSRPHARAALDGWGGDRHVPRSETDATQAGAGRRRQAQDRTRVVRSLMGARGCGGGGGGAMGGVQCVAAAKCGCGGWGVRPDALHAGGGGGGKQRLVLVAAIRAALMGLTSARDKGV